MHLLVLASLVGLAACESGKPRSAPAPTAAVAPTKPGASDAPAPDAPPPDASPLDAEPPHVMTPMDRINAVPAAMVTRDGALVLLRIIDDDGARGSPNLAFELRDRKDRTTKRQVVFAVDEELDDAARARRVAAAEKLIGSYDLVHVPQLMSEAEGHFEREGLHIEALRGRLVVTHGSKRVLDRAVPASWKSKSYVDKVEGITCTNQDFVRTAYAAPAVGLAVVEIAYEGTDSCWAPSPQLHVIAW